MGLRLQQVYRRDLLSTAVPLQAVSIGPTLNHDAVVTGVVHSSFPHALNMVVGDDLWTLLSLGKSDLPFGIRVAADTLAGLPICPGDRVSVRGGSGRRYAGSRGGFPRCTALARFAAREARAGDRRAPRHRCTRNCGQCMERVFQYSIRCHDVPRQQSWRTAPIC